MKTNEAKSNNMPIFAARFAELRGERTQAEFAEFLGISRPTVGFYENGERIPDAFVLKQIAERCGVTTDYLVGLSDNKTSGSADIGKITGLSDEAIESLMKGFDETKKGGTALKARNDFISSYEFDEIIRYIDIYCFNTRNKLENMVEYKELLKKMIVGEAGEKERGAIIEKQGRLDEKCIISLFQAQEVIKAFMNDYCEDLHEKIACTGAELRSLYEQYSETDYCPKCEGPIIRVWGYEDADDPETR